MWEPRAPVPQAESNFCGVQAFFRNASTTSINWQKNVRRMRFKRIRVGQSTGCFRFSAGPQKKVLSAERRPSALQLNRWHDCLNMSGPLLAAAGVKSIIHDNLRIGSLSSTIYWVPGLFCRLSTERRVVRGLQRLQASIPMAERVNDSLMAELRLNQSLTWSQIQQLKEDRGVPGLNPSAHRETVADTHH